MSAPLALPPRLTMAGMFAELSRIIQDDNGAFASGGIYWWGDLRISPTVRSDPLPGVITSEQHASHYVYIALALVMGFGRSNMSEEQTADAYFSRARDLLGDPLERVEWSKDDMSTLSLMAFYYIERNQLEEAYSYVGMALRLSALLPSVRQTKEIKRVICTSCVLDSWLSIRLGVSPSTGKLAVVYDCSPELRAHYKLSMISDFITNRVHGVAPETKDTIKTTTAIALEDLKTWKLEFAKELRKQDDHVYSVPCYYRLHMAYNHLVAATIIPHLKVAVEAVTEGMGPHEWPEPSWIQDWSDSAKSTLALATRLVQSGRILLHAELYCVFYTTTMLILGNLQDNVDICVRDKHEAGILSAIEILQQSGNSTSTARYCDALEELNAFRKHERENGNLDDRLRSWLRSDLFRSETSAIKKVLDNSRFFDCWTV